MGEAKVEVVRKRKEPIASKVEQSMAESTE